MTDRFDLPVWIKEGTEVQKLASGFARFWEKANGWIKTPLNQLDAENCHVYVLKMLAYQRDINRFANEPDELFRKRVKFAVKNAIDSGSQSGFKGIFERFDIPLHGQIERDDETDWDVITLWLADSAITQNPELGQYIIRQYGRTCRRYQFLMVDDFGAASVNVASVSIDREQNRIAAIPAYVFEDRMSALPMSFSTVCVDRAVNNMRIQ